MVATCPIIHFFATARRALHISILCLSRVAHEQTVAHQLPMINRPKHDWMENSISVHLIHRNPPSQLSNPTEWPDPHSTLLYNNIGDLESGLTVLGLRNRLVDVGRRALPVHISVFAVELPTCLYVISHLDLFSWPFVLLRSFYYF